MLCIGFSFNGLRTMCAERLLMKNSGKKPYIPLNSFSRGRNRKRSRLITYAKLILKRGGRSYKNPRYSLTLASGHIEKFKVLFNICIILTFIYTTLFNFHHWGGGGMISRLKLKSLIPISVRVHPYVVNL